MAGRVAVVGSRNEFLRWTDRAEIHRDELPHRSVHVLVFDSAGRMVVQRRHPDKLTWPDTWDVAVSGHVEEEDYHAGPDDDLDQVNARVAARETREELGIDPPLEYLASFPPEAGVHYEQIALFRAVHDGPYVPQPEEVAEVRAFTPAEWDAFEARGGDVKIAASLRWLVRWARAHGVWE